MACIGAWTLMPITQVELDALDFELPHALSAGRLAFHEGSVQGAHPELLAVKGHR